MEGRKERRERKKERKKEKGREKERKVKDRIEGIFAGADCPLAMPPGVAYPAAQSSQGLNH